MEKFLESIAYWFAIGFIVYIIYWSIRNDNAKSIMDQRGFMRMRSPKEPDEKDAPGAG